MRERLLKSMIEAAAQWGYQETSVARVIELAGVARASFYAHFDDIDSCFLMALGEVAEDLLASVEDSVEKVSEGEAGVAMLGALVGFAESSRSAARLLFIESLAAGAEARDIRDRFCEQATAALARAWARLPTDGPLLDVPIEAMVGGVFRLLSMRLRGRESELGGLPVELPLWVNSYVIAHGAVRWREALSSGGVATVPSEPRPGARELRPLRPGRHGISSVEVATDQRERIRAATAQVVYERGYSALTVAEITAVARISRKVFYAQFQNKQQAASEAHEVFFQRGMSATAGAFFSASNWPDRVWEAGRVLTEFVAAHPHETHLSFVESHAIGAPAIQMTYDRLMAFTLFLEEGYRCREEASRLPRLAAEAIAAVMFEAIYREMRTRRSAERLVEQLPALVYICLAPFTGPKAATEFVVGKGIG